MIRNPLVTPIQRFCDLRIQELANGRIGGLLRTAYILESKRWFAHTATVAAQRHSRQGEASPPAGFAG